MTGTTPQAPWDIYAQQLGYLGYGYPLWVPDPAPGSATAEIGDVGWINRGEFQPLFNAFRGEDEAQPRGGVPVDHVPLDIRDCIISGPRDEISQPILCSTSIRRVDISGGLSGTLPLPNISSDISFNFVCTDEAGALLFLEPSGRTQEVLSRKLICDYIGVHFDRWMEFANDRLQIGLRENQIIFVSGTTKTRRWGVAAFKDTTREKTGTVVGNLGSLATMEISVSVSDAQLSPSHYRTGPAERLTSTFPGASLDDQYDQCVFIHYYKRKRRKLCPFPSVMRAAAGPHELPPNPDGGDGHQLCATDSSSDSDDFSDDDVVRLPKHQHAKHAADYILDYILKHSSANVAIASDTDLPILEYLNQSQDFGDLVFPRDIPRYMATIKPRILDLRNRRESGSLSSIPSDTYAVAGLFPALSSSTSAEEGQIKDVIEIVYSDTDSQRSMPAVGHPPPEGVVPYVAFPPLPPYVVSGLKRAPSPSRSDLVTQPRKKPKPAGRGDPESSALTPHTRGSGDRTEHPSRHRRHRSGDHSASRSSMPRVADNSPSQGLVDAFKRAAQMNVEPPSYLAPPWTKHDHSASQSSMPRVADNSPSQGMVDAFKRAAQMNVEPPSYSPPPWTKRDYSSPPRAIKKPHLGRRAVAAVVLSDSEPASTLPPGPSSAQVLTSDMDLDYPDVEEVPRPSLPGSVAPPSTQERAPASASSTPQIPRSSMLKRTADAALESDKPPERSSSSASSLAWLGPIPKKRKGPRGISKEDMAKRQSEEKSDDTPAPKTKGNSKASGSSVAPGTSRRSSRASDSRAMVSSTSGRQSGLSARTAGAHRTRGESSLNGSYLLPDDPPDAAVSVCAAIAESASRAEDARPEPSPMAKVNSPAPPPPLPRRNVPVSDGPPAPAFPCTSFAPILPALHQPILDVPSRVDDHSARFTQSIQAFVPLLPGLIDSGLALASAPRSDPRLEEEVKTLRPTADKQDEKIEHLEENVELRRLEVKRQEGKLVDQRHELERALERLQSIQDGAKKEREERNLVA